MVNKGFLLLSAVIVCVIVLLAAPKQNRPVMAPQLTAGTELAPDFTVRAIDGTVLRLSDYRGKVILLDFWATWCAPCREEIPRFVEWRKEYRYHGLQVIGVSMDDSPEPVQRFSREFRMNYPVAVGTQNIAFQYGGILGLPVNFIIGRDGKIKAKHLGIYDFMLLKRELNLQLDSKE
jgi:cytochrome c biogenesis protein CcmG/thiol:disulfide interchange protein DsbE